LLPILGWQLWAFRAAELGVASLLAVEFTTREDRRAGSINLYWRRPRCFQADDVAFAYIFARHAAVALEHSLEIHGLNVALDGRKLIGQAQGILIERHGLDEKRAFEVLRRYSQDHNLKLRQLAEYLVSTRGLPDRDDLTEPPRQVRRLWRVPGSAAFGFLDSGALHQEVRVGRRGYPPEFRRKVLDLLEEGRSVAQVAHDLDISEQSIYTWRRQDRIDKGLVPGLTSGEKAELTAAKKRIAELETELKVTRRAVELLREEASPKDASRRSK